MTKRITLSILAVGIVALLVSAASFALFTASTDNTGNTFTAGTVTLTGSPSTLFTINNMAPGDNGSATWELTYSGSLPAHLGISGLVSGELADCDGVNSLSVIASVGGTPVTLNDTIQYLKDVTTGDTVDVVVDYNLPLAAGNTCQEKAAGITLTAHAVQTAHNPEVASDPIQWN